MWNLIFAIYIKVVVWKINKFNVNLYFLFKTLTYIEVISSKTTFKHEYLVRITQKWYFKIHFLSRPFVLHWMSINYARALHSL